LRLNQNAAGIWTTRILLLWCVLSIVGAIAERENLRFLGMLGSMGAASSPSLEVLEVLLIAPFPLLVLTLLVRYLSR